eukprot:m.1059286 g.1059286  ORF g.1059286 m.1059286 type:complete len:52 (-) comp24209_c0_seq4:351-506(-)
MQSYTPCLELGDRLSELCNGLLSGCVVRVHSIECIEDLGWTLLRVSLHLEY